ncbi:hypothetical protein P7C70_g233, partial [Phenoliferia sp. Uapishka_3]
MIALTLPSFSLSIPHHHHPLLCRPFTDSAASRDYNLDSFLTPIKQISRTGWDFDSEAAGLRFAAADSSMANSSAFREGAGRSEQFEDEDEAELGTPNLSPSNSCDSSSDDDELSNASSECAEDYFSDRYERFPELSTHNSLLFDSAPTNPTPSSPTKRSALSPPLERHRKAKSAKRPLYTPPPLQPLPRSTRLPDLVVSSLRRSRPLPPCVTVSTADPIPLSGSFVTFNERDELDLELGDEQASPEDPWDWDSNQTLPCPASPARVRPAFLELAAPPPPPVAPTSRPRLVANTAQLLMLSLEATMVRTGKIVSPLRQRGVVVRNGRAECGSHLRIEVL